MRHAAGVLACGLLLSAGPAVAAPVGVAYSAAPAPHAPRPLVAARSGSPVVLAPMRWSAPVAPAAALPSAVPAPAGSGVSTDAPVAVEAVLRAWRDGPLHVDPASTVQPDRGRIGRALESSHVRVAVVPQATADALPQGVDELLLRLLDGLADDRAVVLVVTDGQELQAGSGATAGVDAAAALDQVLGARLDEPFTAATLTDAVVEFARRARPAGTGISRRTIGLIGLAVTAVLAAGLVLGRRRRPDDLEG